MYLGEEEAWRRIRGAVSNVDSELDAILTALRRADLTTARARQPDLDASSEMVAEGISRAIDINVAAAATPIHQLWAARDVGRCPSRPLSCGLEGFCERLAAMPVLARAVEQGYEGTIDDGHLEHGDANPRPDGPHFPLNRAVYPPEPWPRDSSRGRRPR
jgi:hypothetical protein